MLGSCLNDVLIVIVHNLAVVVFASRNDVAHVACLHGVIAILVHQTESILQVALVIESCGGGLVVHHQLHALGVGIVVEHLNVEVGVRSDEVEDVKLLMTEPVFPSFVPSFHQHFLQTVLCSEVDVALHLLVSCAVRAVGLALSVVGNAETNRRQVVGVAPCLCTYNHVPPHTAVFCGMNPRCVRYLAWLVEVESELAREHVAGIVAHHYSTPRCVEGCLDESLTAYGVGSKPRLEGQSLFIEVEVHCRIIQAGSLMYVDVEPVLCLQLQRCLNACVGEYCGGRVALV